MGVIIRQSFKASIVSYIGAGIGAIATLLVYPYFLSAELIGLTRVIIDSSIFLAFFTQIGIPNAIIKYHSQINSSSFQPYFLKIVSFLPLLSFSIISLILIPFKDTFFSAFSKNSPLFGKYSYYILPLAFFYTYINIYESFCSTHQRITVPKIIKEIILRVLIIILVLIFSTYKLAITTYISFIILIYLTSAIVLLIYLIHLKSIHPIKNLCQNPGKHLIKVILVYMIYMTLSGIGATIVSRIDTLMISSMINLSGTGIYSIAFFIATIIEIPARATLQIAAPSISRAHSENKIHEIESIYKKNTINQAIIGSFMFLAIWINRNNIFEIMPNGQIYKEGVYVIFFIGLAKLIDVVTGVNHYIIIYSKYFRYMIIWTFLLAFITIVGNLIFIPKYGISGAALASLFGYLIINSTSIIFIFYKFNIQPFKRNIFYVLFISVFCLSINYIISPFQNCYLDIAVRSFLIIFIYGLFIINTKISPELKNTLVSFTNINSLKKFIGGKP